MAKKLRIGIVGTGGIANAHMTGYMNFPDVEVVGGCDIVPGRARAFLDKYGLTKAEAFESVEELIKNVQMDGASVCTYNTTHAAVTIPLLEAGIHVLCEKPMSFTLEEAGEMVRASRKSGKILTIGFQPRYSYRRQYVDKILGSGELGKIYYVQSGGGRRRGIPGGTFVNAAQAGYGCLGDIGCYSIDECLHGINYPKPLTVSAIATDYFGKSPKYWPDYEKFDVDDFSVALVRMEGDVTFVFKQSWAMHADSLGDTLWLGTEGALKIVNTNTGLKFETNIMLYKDVAGQHINGMVLETVPFNAYGYDPNMNEFTAKVRDFCDAILEGRAAPIPGEEIIYNQAICDGIYRSAKLGKEVEIVMPKLD